jgi:histone-lysine N-methyltransferase SETMAR
MSRLPPHTFYTDLPISGTPPCTPPEVYVICDIVWFERSVLQIPVPKGSFATGKFYRETCWFLSETQTAHRCVQHQIYSMITLRPSMIQEYLKESGFDVLDHPPYSPDLSPCDFRLFPRLKEMLAGHRFESRCGIGSGVYQCLQHIHLKRSMAFRKWVDRCKMCVEADGTYFEGLREIKFWYFKRC